MTVLIDTGVLYADHDTDASRHEGASRALEAVYDGEFGSPSISDYVFDETITLTRARTGSHDDAVGLSHKLRGQGRYPPVFELLHVSRTVFSDATEVFERFDDQDLSFTDATSIALMTRHDIDTILSFDADFDGIVDRTDPENV